MRYADVAATANAAVIAIASSTLKGLNAEGPLARGFCAAGAGAVEAAAGAASAAGCAFPAAGVDDIATTGSESGCRLRGFRGYRESSKHAPPPILR